MKTIEQEIQEVAGVKAKRAKETTERYLARLVRAADGLEEEKWKQLSAGAQKWVNSGIAALNEKKDVPALPDGVQGETEAAPAASKTEAPAAETPAAEKTPEPKTAEKPTEAPPAKPPAAKAPGKEVKKGAISHFRELVVKNPDSDKEVLFAKLLEDGFELSKVTMETVRYEVLATLKVLEKLGKLK